MTTERKSLEQVVLTRVMRLNATVHGWVTGILCALGIFIATNWLVLKGGDVVGPHLSLLGQYFIGYEVTFRGSLVGALYGLVAGFALGYALARMYNWIVDLRAAKNSSGQS
jgi:hypothetical protein